MKGCDVTVKSNLADCLSELAAAKRRSPAALQAVAVAEKRAFCAGQVSDYCKSDTVYYDDWLKSVAAKRSIIGNSRQPEHHKLMPHAAGNPG